MRSKLFLALFFLSFTVALGKKRPAFETIPHVTYLVRVDNQQLVRSADPSLPPWIPEKQFGWHIPNQELLNHFFRQTGTASPELHIDFDRYLVLAILRYDASPWAIEVEKIDWEPKTQHLHLNCLSREIGGPQTDYSLTSLLVLVEKDASFGAEEKIGFSVAENFGDKFILHRSEGLYSKFTVFPCAYVLPDASPKIPAVKVEKAAYSPSINETIEIEDHLQYQVAATPEPVPIPVPVSQKTPVRMSTETPSLDFAAQKSRIQGVKAAVAADFHTHAQAAPPTHISYLDPRGDFPLMEGVSFETLQGFMPRQGLFLSASNYFLITRPEQWNKIMEPGLPDPRTEQPAHIPDFDRHMALVVVKYGMDFWEFETGQAFVSANQLTVNYRATPQPAQGTWVGSSTHIILVEKSGFSQLSLMENGKLVKQTTFGYDAGGM